MGSPPPRTSPPRESCKSRARRLLGARTDQHMIQPRLHTPHDTDFVMIVDDDESIARLLQSLLGQEGYGTIVARDGKAALEILQHQAIVPSVILLDLIMP